MEMISLEKINLDNEYLRLDSDVQDLMKSIETVGLIHPVSLGLDNRLLSGGRRFSAMKELGHTEIPVIRFDGKTQLQRELMSIDENLIRKPLSKLEFEHCLSRGKEIYEELRPEAKKLELAHMATSPAQRKAEKLADREDTTSFVAVTAEKTGLSKGVIKSAIRRDTCSSAAVKEARNRGELSAGQANELIKLDPNDQDQILDYARDKTVKAVRNMVDLVKDRGIHLAIEQVNKTMAPPTELLHLEKTAQKLKKIVSKVIIEDMTYFGPEMKSILKNSFELYALLGKFIGDQDQDIIKESGIDISLMMKKDQDSSHQNSWM